MFILSNEIVISFLLKYMYFLIVAASTYWIITLILVYKSNAAVMGLLDVDDVVFWGCSVDILYLFNNFIKLYYTI
jgi:hypothetical protein